MTSVSVVIPCFNLGEYLPEAVESVRRQTCPPSEIIIVDDGSTDEETLRLLTRLGNEGVRVLRQNNQGAPAARNHGIRKASSPYILCLDADDVLGPTFLEETVPALDAKPDVGVVTTHVEFFGNRQGIWHTPDYSPTTLLWKNCIASASLFRKVCWQEAGGYPDLPACQDWSFWISIIERGWKWTVVPRPLYRYRIRDGSISNKAKGQRKSLLKKLVDLHPKSYKEFSLDIFIEMDAELEKVKKQITEQKKVTDSTQRSSGMSEPQPSKCKPSEQPQNPRMAQLESQLTALKADLSRRDLVERIRKVARAWLPLAGKVLVVSKGDPDLAELEGRQAMHFPQTEDGTYAGFHPAASEDAISHLEALRSQGAEYLLFPSSSFWWLEHYGRFKEHLEQRYSVVVREEDTCLIYRLTPRVKPLQHTFSVVICTYKRAAFLGLAIESLFKQDYPKDKFEIIVINNDSPDNTEQVAEDYAKRSPVPFSYFVEKRNGLSFARNLGVAKATHEYVAFLDDDATACPNWLSSFNAVINDHKALVVGGRVETVFEPGFVPPDWFHFQYTRGFFGVNYRDWGKKEPVFRIRQPNYLGGGNSAYARRLFRHFGGYSPHLGRDGKTLLAGEETYLNLLMEKHKIPIFYSDDAVIYHFIECDRVTKEHLKRKAHWSGITNAIVHSLFFGFSETRKKAKGNWRELRGLVSSVRSSPGNLQNFSRVCRIHYHLAYLRKFQELRLKRTLGQRPYLPLTVNWNPQDWIQELRRLPASVEKYQRLYDLYVALEDEDRARKTHEKLMKYIERASVAKLAAALSATALEEQYRDLVGRIRQTVAANVPAGTTVVVASKGDDEMVKLADRRGWHFPQAAGGGYMGCYPKDSAAAVAQLETLRAGGAEYLLLPATALWWLDHYPGFKAHLKNHYRQVVCQEDTCLIFALDGSSSGLNGTSNRATGVVNRN